MKEYFVKKITSRKFIACVAGVLAGVSLILSDNVTEGAATIIVSVASYIITEGYVDGEAAKKAVSVSQSLVDKIDKNFEDFEDAEIGEDDGNGA